MTLDGLSDVMTGFGRLITPPQESKASAAATKISLRVLRFRANSVLPTRTYVLQMLNLSSAQPERLLEMRHGGNRDVQATQGPLDLQEWDLSGNQRCNLQMGQIAPCQ